MAEIEIVDQSEIPASIHCSGHNILFLMKDGSLQIAGDNSYTKTGVSDLIFIPNPQPLNLHLKKNEMVEAFVARERNIFIYTSHQRLIALYSYNKLTYDPTTIPWIVTVDNNSRNIDPDANVMCGSVFEMKMTRFKYGETMTQRRSLVSSILENVDSSSPMIGFSDLYTWKPLDSISFAGLSYDQKMKYVKCAQHRMERDGDSPDSWMCNENLLNTVLEQIANVNSPPPLDLNDVAQITSPSSSTNIEPKRMIVIAPCELSYPASPLSPLSTVAVYAQGPKPVCAIDYISRNFVGTLPTTFTKVADVIFGINANLYEINGKLILERFNQARRGADHGISYTYGLGQLPMKIYADQRNCYELILPFEHQEKAVFYSNFAYIREGKRYHVIVPFADVDKPCLWYSFTAEFEVDPLFIYWERSSRCLFVKSDDFIWIYQHSIQGLVKLMDSKIKHFFSDNEFDNSLCVPDIENWKIYLNDMSTYATTSNMERTASSGIGIINPIEHAHTIEYVGTYDHGFVLMIFESRPIVRHRVLLWEGFTSLNNVDLVHYGRLNDYCFVFIDQSTNDLCVISSVQFRNQPSYKNFNTSGRATYFEVALPCPASEIVSVEFNGAVVILTSDRVHYAFFNEKFKFRSLSLTRLEPQIEEMQILNLINKEQRLSLTGDRIKNSSRTITINSEHRETILQQFLDAMRGIKAHKAYSFVCTSKIGTASSDGARMFAINEALQQLSRRFFVAHNTLYSLNLSELKKLDGEKLENLGKFLVFAYNNSSERMSIRLPLLLLAALMRRLPTKAELEIFAQLEDPAALAGLYHMKNNTKSLLENGFEDYTDGLKFICKFDIHNDKPAIYDIANLIAIGFLNNVTAQSIQMNIPTLDYCLSGDYVIDISVFVSRVKYEYGTLSTVASIKTYICSLSPIKFRKLLVNWSGSGVVKSDDRFTIAFFGNTSDNNIVRFVTCTRSIRINNYLFEIDPTTWDSFFIDECWHLKN